MLHIFVTYAYQKANQLPRVYGLDHFYSGRFRQIELKRLVRLWVIDDLNSRKCGTEDLLLPHARVFSRRGYDRTDPGGNGSMERVRFMGLYLSSAQLTRLYSWVEEGALRSSLGRGWPFGDVSCTAIFQRNTWELWSAMSYIRDKFSVGRSSTAVNNKNIDAVRRMIDTARYIVTYHEIRIQGKGVNFGVEHSNRCRNMDLLLQFQNKQQPTVWVYRNESKPTKMRSEVLLSG
ncbi:hypothetical protein EVAR_65305_1 [Eumeta japonica]|uniref:Uncharacterized protein n=1 Tax=Eumeta variegata TaxID=151549 RepID=A0A4C1YRB9_EUMVA|nr:hypothetical protein EVAR_65305_1 [Eumeta japonica]